MSPGTARNSQRENNKVNGADAKRDALNDTLAQEAYCTTNDVLLST